MEFEKEFDLQIPDDEAEKIQTVGAAIQYIKDNPIESCNTQMDFMMYLYNFHNTVNLQTGKDTFNYDIFIKKYRAANLGNILNEFIKEYKKSNQSSHGIMMSISKNNIIEEILLHFKTHKNSYSWTAR